MNSALDILSTAQIDVCKAEAFLVSAQGKERMQAVDFARLSLDQIGAAIAEMERARKRIEEELFSNGQETFWQTSHR